MTNECDKSPDNHGMQPSLNLSSKSQAPCPAHFSGFQPKYSVSLQIGVPGAAEARVEDRVLSYKQGALDAVQRPRTSTLHAESYALHM